MSSFTLSWRNACRSATPRRVAAGLYRRLQPRFRCYAHVARLVAGRVGLEIGGPSSLFMRGGLLPIYGIVGDLDNCNFSRTTVWEGDVSEGRTFVYDSRRPAGRQYIHEATDLATIPSTTYSFVLSSHTIEHCANPLKALREWMRIVEDGGAMVLVVPHKEGTFDHRRPTTTLAHLIDDLERDTSENDLTHLPEILALHDLSLDPPARDMIAFKARSERNLENRCLHHHVFDADLVAQMLDRARLQILALEPTRPYHIIVLARKPISGQCIDNSAFLDATAAYCRTSPFAADRRPHA